MSFDLVDRRINPKRDGGGKLAKAEMRRLFKREKNCKVKKINPTPLVVGEEM